MCGIHKTKIAVNVLKYMPQKGSICVSTDRVFVIKRKPEAESITHGEETELPFLTFFWVFFGDKNIPISGLE